MNPLFIVTLLAVGAAANGYGSSVVNVRVMEPAPAPSYSSYSAPQRQVVTYGGYNGAAAVPQKQEASVGFNAPASSAFPSSAAAPSSASFPSSASLPSASAFPSSASIPSSADFSSSSASAFPSSASVSSSSDLPSASAVPAASASPSAFSSNLNQPAQSQIPILRFNQEIRGGQSDNVEFETGNGIRSVFNTKVVRGRPSSYIGENGEMVQTDSSLEQSGHSYHQAPNGEHIALTWSAGANGFQPTGSHLPQPVELPAEHAEAHREANARARGF